MGKNPETMINLIDISTSHPNVELGNKIEKPIPPRNKTSHAMTAKISDAFSAKLAAAKSNVNPVATFSRVSLQKTVVYSAQ